VLEPRVVPAVFVVNSFGDAPDAVPGDGDADISEGDEGITVTLRSAIEEANALMGIDEIRFDIRQAGSPTISPFRALPPITEAVVIDGYSQPGAVPGTLDLEIDATPLVELSGGFAPDAAGLVFQSGASTVRGLVITGFRSGIQVLASNVTIAGNFIGVERDGLTATTNTVGVELLGSGATVGGTTPSQRNLISGNGDGIALVSPATGNLITGNFIGADRTGLEALPNFANGIIFHGSHSNQVGGTTFAAGNLISGNVERQIRLLTSQWNVIQGNRLGVAASGDLRMPRGGADAGIGLELGSAGNTIGGTAPGAGNVIGANDFGILVVDSSDNLIQGNFIGTSAAATGSLSNSNAGIELRDISERNLIGGFSPGSGNVIAFNGGGARNGPGVLVNSPARANVIVGNSSFSNAGLAIDLAPIADLKGPTPNDVGDADSGGNDLQNAPVLTEIIRGSTTVTWRGTLNSQPNTLHRIEFFLNSGGGTSGDGGEGRRFAGFTDVTTDASGNASFDATRPAPATSNLFGTATATSFTSGTSELSTTVPMSGPTGPDPAVVLAADLVSAVPGQPLTYTLTMSNRGTLAARNVSVTFPIPASTTFLSYEGPPAFTSTLPAVGSGGAVTVSAAALGANLTRDLTIVVLVDPTATPGQVIQASANISEVADEPFTDNNQATLSTSVLTPPPGTLSIVDLTVTETDGDSTALVTVSLSSPVDSPVTVAVTTQDGTATAPDDYGPLSQTLTFQPGGPLTQQVAITIKGEILDEPAERFAVVLSNAHGAGISDGAATVTINNDDATPSLLLLDAAAPEGNSGQTQALVTVALSSPPKQPVTLDVATTSAGASATPGVDYIPHSQSLTFQPGGPLTQQVPIAFLGETGGETDEFLFLVAQNVTGANVARGTARVTILDDDVPPDNTPPTLLDAGGIARYGFPRQPTVLVLTFSEALDPATLVDLAAYRIFGAGADRKLGNFDDILYGPISMVHLPESNQVVLRMRKRLPLGQRYELRIGDHGTIPRDLEGNLLDGDADGRPGGVLSRRFGNDAIAGGIRKAPVIPPLPAEARSFLALDPKRARRSPRRG
jgi:uncharacterized repeat protein (TIGR01451 family)